MRCRSITVCPLTRIADIRERKLTRRQFHRRSLAATQLVHTHINLDGREVGGRAQLRRPGYARLVPYVHPALDAVGYEVRIGIPESQLKGAVNA